MSMLLLYHGTDSMSAHDIVTHGLVAAEAARYNGSGEFWATTDPTTADWFARTNPAGGTPTRVAFEVPEQIIQQLLARQPCVVIAQLPNDYEFLSPSFDLLNRSMTNKRLTPVS